MTRVSRLMRFLGVAGYAALILFAFLMAILVRYDFVPSLVIKAYLKELLLLALLIKGPIFIYAGMHRSMLRFAGFADIPRLLAVNASASFLLAGILKWNYGPMLPPSIYVLDFVLSFLCTACVLFSARVWRETSGRSSAGRKRILIYGAGTAGATLLQEIRERPELGIEVAGFLDDDPTKRDGLILGVPVLGSGRRAAAIVHRLGRPGPIEEIVIALPTATGRERREALANCRAARVPCKIIPGIGELLEGKILANQIRDVALHDLLGRPPVRLDTEPIRRRLAGSTILVTGAAGSIGSELCRQIAQFHPARLIAFDQAESELFKIECELRESFPELTLVAALGDIRDPARISDILSSHTVDAVFHAAAYKHVPMMEEHVLEAVQNNVIGTWNLVRAVRHHHVPNFLMISSDKAVNPTNVMGASKRACELIVSAAPTAGRSATKCVSVRFGNVLGSNGSVIPIFRKQIAAGGPVKVTHPEVQRYFMTTSEAVALVLQAYTMGEGSEIFVLDMGEPIRIADLAANMIRLAGLEPHEDIDIEFTGLRPGEKLYEELSGADETMLPTFHEKIRIFRHRAPDTLAIRLWIERLHELIADRREAAVIAHIRQLVPEYSPGSRWARGAKVSPAAQVASAQPDPAYQAATPASLSPE